MSRNVQVPDLSAGTHAKQTSTSVRLSDFPAMLIGFLYEMILSMGMALRRSAVIVGTSLYDRIFIPAAVFVIGLFTAIQKWMTGVLHHALCAGHAAAVRIARIKAHRLTAVLMMSSLIVLVICTSFYSLGLAITIDGKPVGYVMNQSDFHENLSQVETRVSELLGRPYGINPNVAFSFGIVERDKVLNDRQIQQVLYSQVSEVSELYVLTVDDEVVGASPDEQTLKNMVNEILNPSSDPNLKSEFNRNVQITKKMMDTAYIRSYDEMRETLTSNIHEEQTYQIKAGDTMERIAKQHGTDKATLLSYNPGLDPGKLMAGQTIVVNPALPFLSVTQTRRVEYIQETPYQTIQLEDPTQFKGKTTVKTNGSKGQTKIVADVVYKDNKEVSRSTVSSQTIRQAINRIVLVGTKTPPATVATGVFRRPVSGSYISSNYGYRRREFHTGVDFALSYGSKVMAADGGTVSFAGWKGDYGYLVIINHGNGLQTYYGHNSKLLVRAGQKIAKGDQIAKVGSTGRSTGPHCHFEVRVNGKHVNPWRYIS